MLYHCVFVTGHHWTCSLYYLKYIKFIFAIPDGQLARQEWRIPSPSRGKRQL